jgi:hypothetical protein
MTVRNRSPPMMYANSQSAGVEMSLREAFTKAGNAAKAQPQLLVCILPTTGVSSFCPFLTVDCLIRRDQTNYRYRPWYFFSVQSSTIPYSIKLTRQMKHVANPKRQYCANVVLKLNAKLGGANVYLPPRHMPFVSERPTVFSFRSRTNFRLSWALMSITLLLGIPFVPLSVRSLGAWTPVPVATLLPCVLKVLALKSSRISKP